MNCKFIVGDYVTTCFVKNEKYIKRVITNIVPWDSHAQTPWKITSYCANSIEPELSIDSDWYVLVHSTNNNSIEDFM